MLQFDEILTSFESSNFWMQICHRYKEVDDKVAKRKVLVKLISVGGINWCKYQEEKSESFFFEVLVIDFL